MTVAPALTTRQIIVLLTGAILPSIPVEYRLHHHGVYRSLVQRGLIVSNRFGGYSLTDEGLLRLNDLTAVELRRAVDADLAELVRVNEKAADLPPAAE